MVSRIKITKIHPSKNTAHAYNMVSAKNNEASVLTAVRLNKDGSVRKQPGHKAHVSSSKGEEIRHKFQKKVEVGLPFENVNDMFLSDEDDETNQTTDLNESDNLKERLA